MDNFSISSLPTVTLPSTSASTDALDLLLKAAGTNMLMELLDQSPEGVRLALPNGKMFMAQGELPFPKGTMLTVRLDQASEGLKLTTLSATPPPPAPILLPLLSGSEAASLQNRILGQCTGKETHPMPPGQAIASAPATEALRTLALLFETLSSPLPMGEKALQLAWETLPSSAKEALTSHLGLPSGAKPEAVIESVRRMGGQASTPLTSPSTFLSPTSLQRGLPQSPLSAQDQQALGAWLDHAMGFFKASDASALGIEPYLSPKTPDRHPQDISKQTPVQLAQEANLAETAGTWKKWVKGALQVLGDPALSPAEAPFHLAQAQEGTGFFEIPLPWPGTGPLQLWVEEDAQSNRPPLPDQPKRVLLSVQFSQLGQTRIALQSTGSALSVRIWTENPRCLEETADTFQKALQEVNPQASLHIFPLQPNAPDLRTLLVGAHWQGMA